MTDFAKGASQLHYIFLNNAEFSTGVNLTEAFNACRRLTFVDGIDYNSRDSLDEYFGGKGEIVRKDGEYPFYNFMTSSGYATSLGSMFRDCTYLRGMPDGFLDGIHTNEKTISYTQMFYNAFSETLLPSVTISEEDYYNIYQLVLPFTFENGNVLQTFMLGDCGNLASITFKNVDTMTSTANFYMRQNQTLQGFGWSAYYNKRVNSLKVNLGNLKVYVPGSVGYDGYSYLFANFGGWLNSTDRQKTDLFTRDGIEGAPMAVTLSSNCSIAKHQYKYANWIFTDNSKGKVTFKGPSGCDYTTS
jgi:hypothetical protein